MSNRLSRKNFLVGRDLVVSSETQGDVLYFNGTDWVRLVAGTSGKFLKTVGASSNPKWDTPPLILAQLALGEVQITNSLTTLFTASGADYVITGVDIANTAEADIKIANYITASSVNYCYGEDVLINEAATYSSLKRPIVLMNGQALKTISNVASSAWGRVTGYSVGTGEYYNDLTNVTVDSSLELLTDSSDPLLVQSMMIANDEAADSTTSGILTWETNSAGTVVTIFDVLAFPKTAMVEIMDTPLYMAVNDTLDLIMADANAVDVIISYRKV